jgi:hypothetical protein
MELQGAARLAQAVPGLRASQLRALLAWLLESVGAEQDAVELAAGQGLLLVACQ